VRSRGLRERGDGAKGKDSAATVDVHHEERKRGGEGKPGGGGAGGGGRSEEAWKGRGRRGRAGGEDTDATDDKQHHCI
jgi:hypothetical protein